MAKKGQTFKTYSFVLKKKAVEMRLQGIPKAKVAEELGIQDISRLKVWMRKYRKEGFSGLVDRRGRRKEYKEDLERRLKWLEMENEVLKKWFEILTREGKR
jgi:transposase